MAIHIEDVEYFRPAGSAPLLARYYRPEGRGPFPAVLEVHGGAWTSGDRLNNVAIGEYLAAHGIAVLSIDFRMPPALRYPETVAEVNFGIRFLKANAERFATRTDLVGGLGTSSGGHLLLLNALRPRDSRYTALPLAGVDAGLAFAVVCWPVADPLARYRAVRERANERLVEAHHQFWPSEDAMAEGNPQLILERGEPIERPPALIMQGTADDNLTLDMAANFAAAYTRAGGSISFHRFEGQPHAFIARDPAAPDAVRALSLIAEFIHHQAG
ncbi:MAG TPA: alpha/beta hydrolase [Stellaceae bacterium]|jgi:acetyl esterase|nr:alpha/beta hydrolase [Stellaceae bacterium]